jgi:hypothetical protein
MKAANLFLRTTVVSLLVVMAQAATGQPADVGGFAPGGIIASVRSAGFNPTGRPVQRGGVYLLFAVDRQNMNVRLTVDANTGRVLSATRVAGTRLGEPGFEGREALSRASERLVPPGDIPNRGAARISNSGLAGARRLPLPRARPGDIVTGSVLESDPQIQAEPVAAASPGGSGDTTVASPPLSAPPPRPQLPQPTMVPIAPLE